MNPVHKTIFGRVGHSTAQRAPHAPIDPNVMLLDCIFTSQPLRCCIGSDTTPTYGTVSVKRIHHFESIFLDIVLQLCLNSHATVFRDVYRSRLI